MLYNKEAEISLLSIMLNYPDTIPRVINKLNSNSFYTEEHRQIYDAILLRHVKGSGEVDTISIINDTKGKIEPEYILSVAGTTVNDININSYADIVKELSVGRKALEIAKKITTIKDGANIYDTVKAAEEELFLTISKESSSNASSIKESADEAVKLAQEVFDNKDDIIGERIFGNRLDKDIDGARPGDIIVVSGDSGSGKSTLLNNIMLNSVIYGVKAYYWSGELTKSEISYRLLSAMTDIPSRNIRVGDFFSQEPDLKKVDTAIKKLENQKIFVDTKQMDMATLISTIKMYNKVHGVKLFMLDRLELFYYNSNKIDVEKGALMSSIRSIANDLGLTIIMVAQLRKSTQDKPNKKPSMHDILGTGAIFQSATRIILIYRPEVYGIEEFPNGDDTKGKAMIILGKNTFGATKSRVMKFDKERFLFLDENDFGSPVKPSKSTYVPF